ncbi:hypothetical protein JXD38_08170, partial [candidate division WOR-3 bacterium]|nr:hypothetical protein [candidate division WOR-3 bacterium]
MNRVALIFALALVPAAGQDYAHVVITCDSFVPHFAPLCDFVENNLGLSDTVVATEDIYAQFSGRDEPEKIRNFIRYAYQNWGTTHILLGGDVEIVPCRRAWVDATGYNPILLDSIPADLYYADLDGTWDADSDGLYGEPEDSCDMYPDVFVGRVPATTTAAADIFVDKFLTYTGNPDEQYLRNVLLSGFDIFDSVYCETTMELYDSAYIPSTLKPCTKVYDSHAGNHMTAVTDLLNQGQHIWIHADHCNYFGMGMGYMNHGYVMYRNDLAQFTNGGTYTIMTSVGCSAGEFDTADCASEYFMQNPNGGGLAVASNSRYGLGGPKENPQRGGSFVMVEGFVRGLFADTTQGSLEAIVHAWADAVPLAETSSTYRWCLFEWNLLGDAAMPVWIPAGAGVSETPSAEVRTANVGPTVVRGVLFLSSLGTRSELPERNSVMSRAALLDICGRKAMDLAPGANDVSLLPPGVYYVVPGSDS